MPDIYNLLSKHFLNETTEFEESQIEEFKSENDAEYKILKKLWDKESIEVKEFDAEKGWKAVQAKTTQGSKKEVRVIPLYPKLLRIAATVALIITIGFVSYYVSNQTRISEVTASVNQINGGKLVVLADGSKVWLNRNATIEFPQMFEENDRSISLNGEAFFEIVKNPSKPFIINTGNAFVTVLGTSFNVNSNNIKTEVAVATGRVKVMDENEINSVVITEGFSASVLEKEVKKYQTQNFNYQSWRTGEFVFENTTIEAAIKQLNTYYKKQLKLIEGADENCLLSAHFKQASIEDVVKTIELACDVQIIIEQAK